MLQQQHTKNGIKYVEVETPKEKLSSELKSISDTDTKVNKILEYLDL